LSRHTPDSDLEYVLASFLASSECASTFCAVAGPHLLRFSRRFAPMLADDIHGEIVNETLTALLQLHPGAFNPTRGSALRFLEFQVRHAARRVRANYCPPGERTRGSWQDTPDVEEALQTEIPPTVTATSLSRPVDLFMWVAAREVLGLAPAAVASLLHDLYFAGRSMRECARRRGVDHSRVARALRSFSEHMRTAA
jgi:hypothetical protein